MARTTISLDSDLYKTAVKRATALKYKTFSAYVEHLIETDVEKRPSHISVREEPATPPKKHRGSNSGATRY